MRDTDNHCQDCGQADGTTCPGMMVDLGFDYYLCGPCFKRRRARSPVTSAKTVEFFCLKMKEPTP